LTEKYANLAETTLASSYTAGAGSISVTSAAGFPTAGVFRVRLGNAARTILKVTAVAGTTFTAVAEGTDTNAAAGDTVKIVVSANLLEQLLQVLESGRLFVPAGVGGLDNYGPLYKVVYPVTADFAWINQGTAAVDDSRGFTRFSLPSASTSLRIRKKAAPATPYQVDMMMEYEDNSGSKYGGLIFRDGGGKLHTFHCIPTTNNCQIVNFSDPTTFSSNPGNTTLRGSIVGTLQPIWMRIRDDGTNLKFTASRDGRNYFTEMSISRTSFMAGGPTEIGFFGNVDSAAGLFDMNIYDFRVS
jgi:hypothetical protein